MFPFTEMCNFVQCCDIRQKLLYTDKTTTSDLNRIFKSSGLGWDQCQYSISMWKRRRLKDGSVRSDQRQCASAMFGQHLICLINVYAADTLISSSNLDYSVHIILPLLTATRKSVFTKNHLFIKPNSLS